MLNLIETYLVKPFRMVMVLVVKDPIVLVIFVVVRLCQICNVHSSNYATGTTAASVTVTIKHITDFDTVLFSISFFDVMSNGLKPAVCFYYNCHRKYLNNI